ncbi:JM9 [macacine gammaherpesvirus 11]|uniref:JM9 n=2 Tax=macacine gammaherpesvirus 11 TaxID=2560570 RepID=G9JMI7_9GAMA|nr:JM9 [Macaca fuscata rhadinovirus]AAS99986.1 JM9 [Macaca fuscata rhadinovirus]AEW87534.1 JM9 [Macaca fuscata rhadinovirus]AEW87704.1 JM9 [Macaca fuscata rhadinovirus]
MFLARCSTSSDRLDVSTEFCLRSSGRRSRFRFSICVFVFRMREPSILRGSAKTTRLRSTARADSCAYKAASSLAIVVRRPRFS